MWIGERRGHVVDWISQCWVEWTGKRLDVSRTPWLEGPSGSVLGIGADFFQRWGEANGYTVLAPKPDDGLLGGLESLRSPSFDPAEVDPRIHDFYARTAAFDLKIESRWSGPFRALGWLISRFFARRLAQLNLPISARELRAGVESHIVRLGDAGGEVRHTAWVRSSIDSGLPVFVGRYGIATLPGHDGPCVKVTFPLPNGNAIVLLRPRADPGGGLSLLSDGRRFGDPGFYFTVCADPKSSWAREVRTMKERLTLWVEGSTILGRHRFWVFGLPFLELRYQITPKRQAIPLEPQAVLPLPWESSHATSETPDARTRDALGAPSSTRERS